MEFTIPADCPMVNLVSTSFDTEDGYDYVTIARSKYDGRNKISVTIPSSTVVKFHSDNYVSKSGFVLKWSCVTTGKSQLPSYPG